MKKSRWSSWINSMVPSKGKAGGAPSLHKKKGFSKTRGLRLEPLEQRQMLSITVNSTLGDVDSNPATTTLYEAIAQANATPGTDEIIFDGTVFPDDTNTTITLENGQLDLTDDIEIIGPGDPGENWLTIDADDQSRVFSVGADVEASFSNMTITGGNAGYGGGIYGTTWSDIAIDNVTFTGNTATRGGGIYLSSSTATITDSTFSGNGATEQGGGIYTRTTNLAVSDSTFAWNNSGQYGGGMMLSVDTDFDLTNLNISNNSAENWGGGIAIYTASGTISGTTEISWNSADKGGGIYATMGSDLTLTGATITENDADYKGAGCSIYNSTATISNTAFSWNDSDNMGGGLCIDSSTAEVSSSSFSNNSAVIGGGLIGINSSTITVSDSTFSANSGTTYGGGLYNSYGTVNIDASKFMDNDSPQGAAIHLRYENDVTITNSLIYDNVASNQGGGIFTYGDNTNNDLVDLDIINTTIADNIAVTGGGIYKEAWDSVTMANTIVASNDATTDPDIHGALATDTNNLVGVWTDASTPGANTLYGDAIDPLSPGFISQSGGNDAYHLMYNSLAINAGDNSTVNTYGLTTDFDGNGRIIYQAVDIGAYEYNNLINVSSESDEFDQDYTYGDLSLREAIYLANQNPNMDVIFIDILVLPSFPNITITLQNGDLYISDDLEINGLLPGVVTIDANEESRVFQIANDVTVTLSNLTITGGYTDTEEYEWDGGGIYVGSGSTVVINDSVITDNAAVNSGGGIYAGSGSTVVINGSTVSDNAVEFIAGDGIYANGSSKIEINDSEITGNSGDSGGIYGVDTLIEVNNSLIADNAAGIIACDSTIEVDRSVISDNGYFIGGIYLVGKCDNSVITNSLISGNTVPGMLGGGIYTDGTNSSDYVTLAIINSTIVSNAAAVGGGIYKGNAYDEITLANSIVAFNTATTDPDIHGALTADVNNLVRIWTDPSTPGANTLYGDAVTPYDPGFVDEGNDDYHLSDASPAINAGDNDTVNTYGLTDDLDDKDRVINQTVDIGACEFGLTSPTLYREFHNLKIDCQPGDYPSGAKVQIEYSRTGQEGTWGPEDPPKQDLYNQSGENTFGYVLRINEPLCYRAKILYDGKETNYSADIIEVFNDYIAYDGQKYWDVLVLTADVQTGPEVTLKWTDLYNRNDALYQIKVRPEGGSTWTTLATDLDRDDVLNASPSGDYDGLCWTDTISNLDTDTIYEYEISWVSSSGSGSESVEVGVEMDKDTSTNAYAFEDRGSILLVIDDRFADELSGELEQLKADFVGDGWNVISEYIDIDDPDPSDAHIEVKDLIKSHYDVAANNLQAVYLIGHIPVPLSGWCGPDGHAARTMPADVYYGDMDGTWTDTTIDEDVDYLNTYFKNIPGDGKFDQNYIPAASTDGNTEAELQVGRIDMYDMDGESRESAPDSPNYGDYQHFAESEAELLRRYLNKAHDYRSNLWDVEQSARLTLPAQEINGRAGFQLQILSHLVGLDNVDYSNKIAPTTEGEPVYAYGTIGSRGGPLSHIFDLLSTGTLSGNEENIVLVGKVESQDDFDTINTIFNTIAWSNSMLWELPSHIMRGYLANDGYGLTVCSRLFNTVPYNTMALGDTVGEVHQFTQNDGGSTFPVYVALMGDPALRQHTVGPVSEVTVSAAATGVDIQWNASDDSGDANFQGYRVYRASVPGSGKWEDFEFAPVSDLVTGTSYNDTTGATSGYVYMVRAITLEHGNLGSYYNASQGAYSVPVVPELDSNIYYQINAGGSTIIDTDNETVWEGNALTSPTLSDYVASPLDTYATWTGSEAVPDASFDLTATPSIPLEVFQSARETSTLKDEDTMSWEFTVNASQTVNVTLYFAEIGRDVDGAGQRVFDIRAEGSIVSGLDDYDIYAEAGGKYTSVAETFQVTASADGILNLDFIASEKDALICGILITDTDPTPNTLYQINAGGPGLGGTWEEDSKASPVDNLVSYTHNIRILDVESVSSTLPLGMFQSARESERDPEESETYVMSWEFDVPAYTDVDVTLYFAECESYNDVFTGGYVNSVGDRVFDIVIEGNVEEEDYDIFDDADGILGNSIGADYKAITRTYSTTVSADGKLNIVLDASTVTSAGVPAICGIQITEHVAAMGGGMMMALPMIEETVATEVVAETEDVGITVVDTEDPAIGFLPSHDHTGHRHGPLKPVLSHMGSQNNLERIDRIDQAHHRFSFGEKQGPVAPAHRYHGGSVDLTPSMVDEVLAGDVSEAFVNLDFDFSGNLEPHDVPFAELVASMERPFKHR